MSVDANTSPNASGTASEIESHNKAFAPKPPKFDTQEEEREWLKFRLAQAFRIFGNMGFNEGVAGHITVRVCTR